MPQIKLQDFSGMVPSRDPRLLPDNNAAYSRNTWLYRGSIQGYRSVTNRHTVSSSNVQGIYRIPLGTATDFANSVWVELSDGYTNVIRAPVVGDTYERYYFFSPSSVPQYSPLSDLQTNAAKLTLGVPTPVTAPIVAVVPPSPVPSNPVTETRSYVYTWVTQYGEEGAPSPAKVVSGTVGSSYNITVTAPTNTDKANRRLSKVNIYRTVTDSAGNATYYFVTSFVNTAVNYLDAVTDATVTSNVQLESNYWTPPPSLQGCVAMSNGMLAGWANETEIWFCEPYRPHAWPAIYAISVPYTIVGMGVVNNSLVIATEGYPYIATGITPSSMSLSAGSLCEPCISRASIISAPEGVYYASANGLVMVNTGTAAVVTEKLLTRQDWTALGPANFIAAQYGSAYVAFSRNTNLANGSGDNGIVIDPAGQNVTFCHLRFPSAVKNVIQDEYTSNVFVLSGTTVYEWDDRTASAALPYIWRSKLFQMPYRREFAAALIFFDVPASVTIAAPTEATRNLAQPQTFNAATQYLILRVYADNTLVMTREIQKSGELIMLPSGFKANFYQFEVEGQVAVSNIQIATGVKDLRAV